uniref:Retrotransposon gag domain-containing protein n=1 Tax=Vitis vinifera TaxID=29760 RepID=F6I1M8_VITVI
MSDETTPITLTALYEMMVDLTRRVERIELILSGHPSSSRGASGVAMPSLPHLTSSTPATLGASHPRSRPHSVFQQHSSSISLATPTRPPPQFRGPPIVTVPQDRFPPHRRCRRHFSDLSAPLSRVFEMFQAMGFLAPLAPRALPDPVPPQFRLDLYCAYHQSAGHHTDRCTALRHAIQDIVDSGTFGHPQSDMFPIPTSAQAMHADASSPVVPDLIDLGD